MKVRAIILVLVLAILPGCFENDLRKNMVAVDQAYIPTVFFIKKEKKEEARTSMLLLQREWQNLMKSKEQLYLNKEEEYVVAEIDLLLEAAAVAIVDQNLYQALCRLEDARFLWNDWRVCNDMTYYLDYLYEFQMAWEVVVESLEDPDRCWLNWQIFHQDVMIASQAWSIAYRAEVEWELFPTVGHNQMLFAEYRTALETELKRLVEAVDQGQLDKTIQEAEFVSEKFDDLLNLFGNFNHVGGHIVQL